MKPFALQPTKPLPKGVVAPPRDVLRRVWITAGLFNGNADLLSCFHLAVSDKLERTPKKRRCQACAWAELKTLYARKKESLDGLHKRLAKGDADYDAAFEEGRRKAALADQP